MNILFKQSKLGQAILYQSERRSRGAGTRNLPSLFPDGAFMCRWKHPTSKTSTCSGRRNPPRARDRSRHGGDDVKLKQNHQDPDAKSASFFILLHPRGPFTPRLVLVVCSRVLEDSEHAEEHLQEGGGTSR